MKHDIADEVDRFFEMLAEHGSVHHRFFFRSIGIQLTANIFETVDDMSGTTFLSTFKQEVFHEMGHSVFIRSLVAGTRIDHHTAITNRDGLFFQYDAKSSGKGVELIFHVVDSVEWPQKYKK